MVAHASQNTEGNATFDGAYEILSAVGRGRNSVVYRARKIHPRSAREEIVALKVLLGNAKQKNFNHRRMRREALAMLACRHPNVIRLNDFVSTKDLSYLSMEYADGGDLRALLESRIEPLSVEKSLNICIQILLGVEAIHRAGVLHRDLKPENVLLCSNGGIKIADFGVSVLPVSDLNDDDAALGVGTFDYLAPESLRDGAADVRSDLYSVGVTLFQLVTQHLPFEGRSISGQIEQKMKGLANPVEDFLPNAPSYLSPLLRKALANNPADRFQSAAEFHHALERCLQGTWKPEDRLAVRSARNEVVREHTIVPNQAVAETALLLPLNEESDDASELAEGQPRFRKPAFAWPDFSPPLFAKLFAALFLLFALFAAVRWLIAEPPARIASEAAPLTEARVAPEEREVLAKLPEEAKPQPAPQVPTEQRAMLSTQSMAIARMFASERIGVLEHLFADGSDVAVVTTPAGENKVLFALGLVGWRPVEIDIGAIEANRKLEIHGSGITLLLEISEPSASGDVHILHGTFTERSSGREGNWKIW